MQIKGQKIKKAGGIGIGVKLMIIFMLFLLLNAAGFFVVQYFLALQESDGLVINLAGAQRMLSQRMTKEALLVATGHADARDALLSTAQRFNQVQAGLLAGDETLGIPPATDPEVRAQLSHVAQLWNRFYPEAQVISREEDPALVQQALSYMVEHNVELLTAANEAVNLLEKEAAANVNMLQQIQLALMAGNLVIVVLGFVLARRMIVYPVKRVQQVLLKMADNDLQHKIELNSRDEIGQMAQSLNQTIDALNVTLAKVKEASDNVSNASSEISSGNQDLSQRTEEQASSLEEISSTIENISSALKTSSANAVEADNLSRGTMSSVQRGEDVVRELQGAMGEITKGSQEISEIISTVNDIAFQTNLLALNAAVEAARAGEQGRGFAVVASEVRNLASRSAASAKEIEALIKDSIVRVERGNNLMLDTEKVLQEIVINTQKASDVVGEIAASLKEQTTASSDISIAIEELNQVTQQNAALVEEIASSSENMNAEAMDLSEQVGFFKLA